MAIFFLIYREFINAQKQGWSWPILFFLETRNFSIQQAVT